MEKRGDFSTGPAVLLDHAKFYSFFDLEREKKTAPFIGQFESLEAIRFTRYNSLKIFESQSEKIFQEFFEKVLTYSAKYGIL